MDRRSCLKSAACLGLYALTSSWEIMQKEITKRSIPSTKEQLPVVGLGTWQTFDVDENSPDLTALRDVLRTLHAHGGQVIDSSPMYGRSEAVVGELSQALNLNSALFLATKVWTQGKENGIRQMEESMKFLTSSVFCATS